MGFQYHWNIFKINALICQKLKSPLEEKTLWKEILRDHPLRPSSCTVTCLWCIRVRKKFECLGLTSLLKILHVCISKLPTLHLYWNSPSNCEFKKLNSQFLKIFPLFWLTSINGVPEEMLKEDVSQVKQRPSEQGPTWSRSFWDASREGDNNDTES